MSHDEGKKIIQNSSGIKEKLQRLIEIQKELDLRKALYAEYDLIVMGLAKEHFLTGEIDGLVLTLEDKFAEGNTGWTSAAVKRYEMRIETKEKFEKRVAKRMRGEEGAS